MRKQEITLDDPIWKLLGTNLLVLKYARVNYRLVITIRFITEEGVSQPH